MKRSHILLAIGGAVIVCVCVCLVAVILLLSLFARKPPHYGVFLKEGTSFIELAQGLGGPADLLRIPETSNQNPLVIFWVPQTDLSSLMLQERIGGIGVSLDSTGIIKSVEPGSPAEEADLRVGDRIVRVNGVDVSTSTEVAQQTLGSVGSSVTIMVQRTDPGQSLTVECVRAPVNVAPRKVGFDASPRTNGTLEIRPRAELSQGMYCLVGGGFLLPPDQVPYWCFMLKP